MSSDETNRIETFSSNIQLARANSRLPLARGPWTSGMFQHRRNLRSKSTYRLVKILASLFCIGLLFACVVPRQQFIDATGQINTASTFEGTSGEIATSIQSGINGRLFYDNVRERMLFQKGDVIAHVSDDELSGSIEEAKLHVNDIENSISSLDVQRSKLLVLHEAVLSRQRAELVEKEVEVFRLERIRECDLLLAQSEINAETPVVEHSRKLFLKGFLTRAALDRAEGRLNALKARVAKLSIPINREPVQTHRSLLVETQRDVDLKKSQLDAEIEDFRDKAKLAQHTLENLEKRSKELTVTAPYDLRISKLHKRNGEYVTTGQQLFEIAPDGEFEFIARVRPKDIGRIHPGQKVRLELASSDKLVDKPFKGSVIAVSPEPAVWQSKSGQRRFYLVRIRFDFRKKGARRVELKMDGTCAIDTGQSQTLMASLVNNLLRPN